ncbi:hypothetical protein ACRAWF_43510 [Streptomyces sp. L7]
MIQQHVRDEARGRHDLQTALARLTQTENAVRAERTAAARAAARTGRAERAAEPRSPPPHRLRPPPAPRAPTTPRPTSPTTPGAGRGPGDHRRRPRGPPGRGPTRHRATGVDEGPAHRRGRPGPHRRGGGEPRGGRGGGAAGRGGRGPPGRQPAGRQAGGGRRPGQGDQGRERGRPPQRARSSPPSPPSCRPPPTGPRRPTHWRPCPQPSRTAPRPPNSHCAPPSPPLRPAGPPPTRRPAPLPAAGQTHTPAPATTAASTSTPTPTPAPAKQQPKKSGPSKSGTSGGKTDKTGKSLDKTKGLDKGKGKAKAAPLDQSTPLPGTTATTTPATNPLSPYVTPTGNAVQTPGDGNAAFSTPSSAAHRTWSAPIRGGRDPALDAGIDNWLARPDAGRTPDPHDGGAASADRRPGLRSPPGARGKALQNLVLTRLAAARDGSRPLPPQVLGQLRGVLGDLFAAEVGSRPDTWVDGQLTHYGIQGVTQAEDLDPVDLQTRYLQALSAPGAPRTGRRRTEQPADVRVSPCGERAADARRHDPGRAPVVADRRLPPEHRPLTPGRGGVLDRRGGQLGGPVGESGRRHPAAAARRHPRHPDPRLPAGARRSHRRHRDHRPPGHPAALRPDHQRARPGGPLHGAEPLQRQRRERRYDPGDDHPSNAPRGPEDANSAQADGRYRPAPTRDAGDEGPASHVLEPAPKDSWFGLRAHARPAVHSTERFDPHADQSGPPRPGVLSGATTLVRTRIRRIQAPNGTWVRDYTLNLPVATNDPALTQQFKDRITGLLDTHINSGLELPGSRDQLHVTLNLIDDPTHPEAITLTGHRRPGPRRPTPPGPRPLGRGPAPRGPALPGPARRTARQRLPAPQPPQQHSGPHHRPHGRHRSRHGPHPAPLPPHHRERHRGRTSTPRPHRPVDGRPHRGPRHQPHPHRRHAHLAPPPRPRPPRSPRAPNSRPPT